MVSAVLVMEILSYTHNGIGNDIGGGELDDPDDEETHDLAGRLPLSPTVQYQILCKITIMRQP